MASARLATAKRFIGVFATLDVNELDSILAPGYTHQFRPGSLALSRENALDRQTFVDHFSGISTIMSGFPVTAKEYTDSESSRRVVIWAIAVPAFRGEAKDSEGAPEDWDCQGEYIFQLTMDETGEQIVHTLEFLDSKVTADALTPLMHRARANLEKK